MSESEDYPGAERHFEPSKTMNKEADIANVDSQKISNRKEKSEVAQMFAGLVELAKSPDVDAGKMGALADLQLKMINHKQQEEFNRDKIAALLEMPAISKGGAIKNKAGAVQSRYAYFEDIHRAVVPILRRHNLAISFNLGNSGQMVTVRPILSHTNGYVERGSEMSLPIDTTGSKNGTQGAGSAASYGKRHTMKAMLNIIEDGEDNDGQGAGVKYIEKADWQEELIDDGRKAALGGIDSYEAFFKSQSAMRRGFLVDSGEHEKLKVAAQNHSR